MVSILRNTVAIAAHRALAPVIVGLALGGCAMQPPYPPAPRDAATADYAYHIGPLDVINVIVWRNLGKTPTELERDMEKALVKYIRDPVVTVVVTNFVGPTEEQVRVTGEAAKPQILAYRKNMTVLDVMIAVGGLTDFADGNGARIYRPAEGGKLYNVRLKDLVKRGDISANVEMKPGDILIIPQSWF